MDTIQLAKIRNDVKLRRERDFWRDCDLTAPMLRFDAVCGGGRGSVTADGARLSVDFSVDAAALLRLAANSDHALLTILVAALRHLGFRCGAGGPVLLHTVPFSTEFVAGGLADILPLPLDYNPSGDVRSLLRSVRTVISAARAHQNYPLAAMLADQGVEATTPAVGILLRNIQNPRYFDAATPDMLFNWTREDNQLHCRLDASGSVINKSGLEKIAGMLRPVLASMSANIDQPLRRVDTMSAEQRQAILETWSRGSDANDLKEEDSYVSFAAHVLTGVAHDANRHVVAIVDGERELTRGEVFEQVCGLAAALRQAGIKHGQPVALCMRRSVDLPVAMLGVMLSGAMLVALDPDYPAERLQYLLNDSGAQFIVSDMPELLRERGIRKEIIPPRHVEVEFNAGEFKLPPAESAAYCIYTSGSTGRPKGVVISQESALQFVLWGRQRFKREDLSGVAATTSVCFDLSIFELFVPLMAGGKVIVLPNALSLADHPRAAEITLLNTVPSAAAALLEKQALPAGVRVVNLAGEALRAELVRAIHKQRPAVRVFNLYGPSEATTYATFAEVRATDDYPLIGRPVADTRIYVLDADMNPVPPGLRGELYLGGGSLAVNYLNRPSLSAAHFVPNPFADVNTSGTRLYRTGDIVSFANDGNLAFHGRRDDQVKVRGYRIEPGEIEARLNERADVARCAVLVMYPAEGDELQHLRLAAFVVSAAGTMFNETDLREQLAALLPVWMLPTLWFNIDELPLTPSGKTDKRALEQRVKQLESADALAQNSAGDSEIETELLAIWRAVLGRTRIGRLDNFFAVGGDSILALRIVARAAQRNLQILPALMFTHQTVAALAPHVKRGLLANAEQGTVTGTAPLTPVQRWFMAQEFAAPAHWNQAVVLEAPADIDIRRIETIAGILQEHHDALRTRLTRSGEQEFASTAQLAVRSVDCPDLDIDAALEIHADSAHTALDLDAGPVWSLLLLHCRGGRNYLLISIHHMVVDVVSWNIIVEDLRAIDAALRSGAAPEMPPKTTSFRDWARAMAELPGRVDLNAECGEMNNLSSALPRDFDADETTVNTEANQRLAKVTLDAGLTTQLVDVAAGKYRTRVDEFLLAALALALRAWTGEDRLLLARESHGRETPDSYGMPDVSRTVGWFTAIAPLLIGLPYSDDPADIIISVKEQLRRNSRASCALNVACSAVAGLAPAVRPELVFNYLGRYGEASGDDNPDVKSPDWRLSLIEPGRVRAAENRRPWLLEINAGIDRSAGDVLQLYLAYCPLLHDEHSMQALLERTLDELRRLIEHCANAPHGRYTPSDFTALTLQQDELDNIAAEIESHGGHYPSIADILPSAPLQAGMLMYAMLDGRDNRLYTQVFEIRLSGDCDAAALERAWNAVFNRHDSLRAAFVVSAGHGLLQAVQAHVRLPFELRDVSGLNERQQEMLFNSLHGSETRRGFDMHCAPLSRLFLYRTGPTEWRLFWVHHHAIVDGWSLPLIVGEVLELYAAERTQGQARLRLAPTLRDYALWLNSNDPVPAEEFWREELRAFTQAVDLGFDRVRVNNSGRDDRELDFALGAELSTALRSAARLRRVTLNTLVQVAWARVLGMTAGVDDVVFGVTVSGRPPQVPGMAEMVGMFINTVPARFDLSTFDNSDAVLQQARDRMAQREQHAWMSLPDIIRLAEVNVRDGLFNSILVFENYPLDDQLRSDFGGMFIRDARARERTNFPLTLVVRQSGELHCSWLYDASLLSAERVTEFQDLLRATLTELLAPGRAEQVFPLLTSEPETAESSSRSEASPPPVEESVYALFNRRCDERPNATALRGKSVNWTYEYLRRQAEDISAWLWRWGVRPADVVAIDLPRSPLNIAVMPACMRIGAVALPLDPQSPPSRRETMLSTAASRFLVCRERPAWLPPECHALEVDTLLNDLSPEPVPAFDSPPAATAYIMFTSGSTGRPKGVEVPQRAVVRLAGHSGFASLRHPGAATLALSSPAFDASTFEVWAALLNGAAVQVFEDEFIDPEVLADCLQNGNITHLWLTSSLFNVLAEERPAMFAHLDTLLVGGEALSTSHVLRVRQACPELRLFNGYGPTENTTFSTLYEITADFPVNAAGVPIGRAIDRSTALALDGDMRLAPPGALGELYVGGEGLAHGYVHSGALTAARFVPNPYGRPGERLYRTGDLVRRRRDGLLDFVGRADSQVKLRGFRIEPGEIEARMYQDSEVRRAVVFVHGDRLCALYEGAEDSEARIRRNLAAALPSYMLPDLLQRVELLPLNLNGKIDRSRLADLLPTADPEREVAGRAGDAESSGSKVNKMAVVERLLAIMRKLLDAPQMQASDGFFEMGGNSISAIQLVARAANEGMHLKLRDVFNVPQAAKLAGLIRRDAVPNEHVAMNVPLRPLPAQAWFAARKPEQPRHFNLSILLRLKRALDPRHLREAVKQLAAAHPIVRTVYDIDGQDVEISEMPHSVDFFSAVELDSARDVTAYCSTLQRAFEPGAGPLFGVHLLSLRDGSQRLFLIGHHLLLDVVSIRILLDELDAALNMEVETTLPVEFGARLHAYRLRQWTEDPEFSARLQYWRNLSGTISARLPRRKGELKHNKGEGRIRSDVKTAAAETTGALLRGNESPENYLLTALSVALRRRVESGAFVIELEHHGRSAVSAAFDDAPDLARAVGWFTAVYPLLLPAGADAQDTLKQVVEERNRVPHDGLPFAAARYLAPQRYPELTAVDQPEIAFNYLGELDAALRNDRWETAAESGGDDRPSNVRPTHCLTCNAWVENGTLKIGLAWDDVLLDSSTSAKLLDDMIRVLDDLAKSIVAPQTQQVSGARPGAPEKEIPQFADSGLDATNMAALLDQVSRAVKGD